MARAAASATSDAATRSWCEKSAAIAGGALRGQGRIGVSSPRRNVPRRHSRRRCRCRGRRCGSGRRNSGTIPGSTAAGRPILVIDDARLGIVGPVRTRARLRIAIDRLIVNRLVIDRPVRNRIAERTGSDRADGEAKHAGGEQVAVGRPVMAPVVTRIGGTSAVKVVAASAADRMVIFRKRFIKISPSRRKWARRDEPADVGRRISGLRLNAI